MTATPYTSANFYQLAMKGYYNGLAFHRVIANFVAQGGDPDGTGQGGPGYSIREELYPVEHNRGTIGMATSGKDTGGSQFFFNNTHNIHLNNNYTVFARVTEGLELIDLLEAGDKIISINEI
ncbi:MAG: peptidylprolyl isomerase [Gammaproteobacteria bacterium]|nr:MAG: peptidylprolyl isomerase [Gammaproteobacteria bacterium]